MSSMAGRLDPHEYGQLRGAWRDLLDRDGWDFYVTATFRTNVYVPEYCLRKFQEWLTRWEEAL